MADPTDDAIVAASLKGIVAAQKAYGEWTNGEWLWKAPEYLSTVYVAREIGKLPAWITLENSARSALSVCPERS
ncbi:MAG: hypothetical protein ACLQOQ_16260 [Beijerinckiaceae bacterium]